MDPPITAFLGSGISIIGTITSTEDLYLDGQIEGSIEAAGSIVTVGLNARLTSGITARRVVILGSVLGPIVSLESVELRKTGKLFGDVRTARIVIEDGADFKGSIDISRGAAQAQPPAAAKGA